MKKPGTLYFFCGKMAAGKSTTSKEWANDKQAVLLSEDEWIASLYPKQVTSFDDYLTLSQQIKPLVKQHVQNILRVGTNVVMDFPANTKKLRTWFLEIATEVDADHQLIFLNMTNDQCLHQLAQRRIQQPERAAFDTKDMFMYVTSFFEEPKATEGLTIVEVKK